MKLIILLNPRAGRGRAGRRLRAALDVLTAGGAAFDLRESRSPEHLLELAQQAADERPDAVVSAGGDGTHHFVINGVFQSDVPVGFLSLGTGNDFARALSLPFDPRKAASVILKGTARPVDLGRVGSRVYCCIAGVGFDTVITRCANEQVKHLHGSLAYAWAIVRCLKHYRPLSVHVSAGAQSFSGDVIFMTVGNSTSYGGGLRMTPRARMDDGLLDVCIVPSMPKLELLRWLPAAYRGQHLEHPRIGYFRAPVLTISADSPLELFGDGEYLQDLPATIEAVPRALRVLVPG